jgi:hypothetical protein
MRPDVFESIWAWQRKGLSRLENLEADGDRQLKFELEAGRARNRQSRDGHSQGTKVRQMELHLCQLFDAIRLATGVVRSTWSGDVGVRHWVGATA